MKKFLLINLGTILSVITSFFNFYLTAKYFGTSINRDIFIFSIMVVNFVPQLIFGQVFENIRYSYLDLNLRNLFKKFEIIGRTISVIFLANIFFALFFYLGSFVFEIRHLVFWAILCNMPVFFISSVNIIATNILYSYSNKAVLICNIISSIVPSILTILLHNSNTINTFIIINYSLLFATFIINAYFLVSFDLVDVFVPGNPFKKTWYLVYRKSSYLYVNFIFGQFYRYFETSFLMSFNNGSVSLLDYVRRIIDFIKNFVSVILNAYMINYIVANDYRLKSIKKIACVFTILSLLMLLLVLGLFKITSIIDVFNITVIRLIFESPLTYLVFCLIFCELVNFIYVVIYYTIKGFRPVAIVSSIQMICCALIASILRNYFEFASILIALIISLSIAIVSYHFVLKKVIKN